MNEQDRNEFENQAESQSENTEVSENAEAVTSENAENAENVTSDQMGETSEAVSEEAVKPKKSKKGLIIGLAALAVIVASIVAFWKPIANFAVKTVKSPEEYYLYVEKQNLQKANEALYELLDEYEYDEDYKMGSKYSLKLETGKGLSDVASLIGFSAEGIEWLKSIEFAGKINASINDNNGNLQGLLNDKEIFDFSFAVDGKNGAAYFALPVATQDKYLKVDFEKLEDMMKEQFGEEYYAEMFGDDMLEQYDFSDVLPEEEVMEQLLIKYFDIIVKSFGEAKETSDKLTIGKVTQSLTLITFEIDEIDAYNALKAVCQEAKTDKELEKILRKVAEKLNEDPDKAYDSFVEVAENAITEADFRLEAAKKKSKEELAEETVIYKVWVNNKGEAVARSFVVEASEDVEFFTGTVKDGKDIATETRFEEDGDEMLKFKGEATLSGTKLSGEYTLYVEEYEFIVLEAKDVAIKTLQDDGEFYGTLTLSLGKMAVDTLSISDEALEEYFETAKLVVTSEKNKGYVELSTKGETIIKLTASEVEQKFENAKYPDESKVIDVFDEEALMKLLEDFDVEKIFNALKEAGVPEDLIDAIVNGMGEDNGYDEDFSWDFDEDFSFDEDYSFDMDYSFDFEFSIDDEFSMGFGDDVSFEDEVSAEDPSQPELSPLAGTYDVTLWVSETAGVAELTKAQIKEFMAANPGVIINASIECVTEYDAGPKVIADVATAPDIFCFSQNQLARLVQSAALAAPVRSIASDVIAANDDGAINAAAVAGTLYAYPYVADNGYYMYYDKSIISAEDAKSLEKLIAACEKNGKKFRFALENAWYTASFFFATGCESEWTMDVEGNFNGVDDTFNSAEGLAAMKGMQILTSSIVYDNNADEFSNAGVIVTGLWNDDAARTHFGDNYAVAVLPSFTVNGKTYQLGSFSGYKLMGVKPQADAKKSAVLSLLAQYLTGEKCQMERYEKFNWIPTNKNVLSTSTLKANAYAMALVEQNQHAHPQLQIHGSWWDIAKQLGYEAKVAKNDNELKAALKAYETAINSLFDMSEEEKNAWGVIGSICGTFWDTDFPMTKASDTVWESEALDLKAGDEFKVRQGKSWDVNFGETYNGNNLVVATDGKYIVRFSWDGGTEGTIELIKAE